VSIVRRRQGKMAICSTTLDDIGCLSNGREENNPQMGIIRPRHLADDGHEGAPTRAFYDLEPRLHGPGFFSSCFSSGLVYGERRLIAAKKV
jgi:hypothetical protein